MLAVCNQTSKILEDTYDTNTTLANQTRAELMDTVSGGFNNVRGAIADNFSDTRSDVNRVAAQVGNAQNSQAATTQSEYGLIKYNKRIGIWAHSL